VVGDISHVVTDTTDGNCITITASEAVTGREEGLTPAGLDIVDMLLVGADAFSAIGISRS